MHFFEALLLLGAGAAVLAVAGAFVLAAVALVRVVRLERTVARRLDALEIRLGRATAERPSGAAAPSTREPAPPPPREAG
ncbi:MAG: hypothetical protein D6738_00710, partial [Acidobacteria bacterium]